MRQIPHSVADLPGEAVVKHVGVRIPELIQRLAVVAVPVGIPVKSPEVAFDLSRECSKRILDPGPFVADQRHRSQAAVGDSDLPVPSDERYRTSAAVMTPKTTNDTMIGVSL